MTDNAAKGLFVFRRSKGNTIQPHGFHKAYPKELFIKIFICMHITWNVEDNMLKKLKYVEVVCPLALHQKSSYFKNNN